jgi:hypothetical protein
MLNGKKSWYGFMMVLVVVLILAETAFAKPYFRLLDLKNPYRVAGAYIDPEEPKLTAAGSAIALITHSTRDGCALPWIVCTDWSPAMLGFSYSAGRYQANVGPAINMTPLTKAIILRVVNATTKEDKALALKSILGSEPVSGPDVSFAFGPALQVEPVAHGVVLPFNEWRGKLRIFTGASLQF